MQGDWPYLRVPQHEDTKKNAAWTVVESPEDGWKNLSCFFHTLRSTITCLMDLEKRGNCPKTIGSQGGWHVMIFLNLSKFATPWIRTSCWITTLWNFMRILFVFLSGSFHVVLNTWIFLKVIFPHKKKQHVWCVTTKTWPVFKDLLEGSYILTLTPGASVGHSSLPAKNAHQRHSANGFLGDSRCLTRIPPMGLVYVPTCMVDLCGESRQIYHTWILWGMITSHVFCWQTTMGSFLWLI